MTTARKDNKGRNLNKGESQRKDGKYEYKYVDALGNRRTFYSWRLNPTDKCPPGKRCSESLREIESDIKKKEALGIDAFGNRIITMDILFEQFILVKDHVRTSTITSYKRTYNSYIRKPLGNLPLEKIKYTTIKLFYKDLYKKNDLAVRTIGMVHNVLTQMFKIAIRNKYIINSPCEGVYTEFKKELGYQRAKRHPLSEEEQAIFLNEVLNHNKYASVYPLFVVGFGTGLRAGEISALTWADCDFKNRTISVNKTISNADSDITIEPPKTTYGNREVPMIDAVYDALLAERKRQMKEGFGKARLKGVSGFVFQTNKNEVYTATKIDQIIKSIVKRYNAAEKKKAALQNRMPELLPDFSSHIMRHTFCTRFCEVETDLKTIQMVMGHASIVTTMDIYNETTEDRKKISLNKLNSMIKFG